MNTAIAPSPVAQEISREVTIPIGKTRLHGQLSIPTGSSGIVLFAHGSGSSRHSPRNQFVARVIRDVGISTLLFDLLTSAEEAEDNASGSLRFNIRLLADRLIAAAQWVSRQHDTANLQLGFFGSSTGGAAAIIAAAELGKAVGAVVSRGGRPDLAMASLSLVTAPTLLIVGEYDDLVLHLNQQAYAHLGCDKKIEIVSEASHLFEEEGALDRVASLAANWFARHLRSKTARKKSPQHGSPCL